MMKPLKWLLLLLLPLWLVGCEEDDAQKREIIGEQTLFMYLPWSGDAGALTGNFLTNIQDVKEVIANGLPVGCRVMVFFMENNHSGRLFELMPNGRGAVYEQEIKTYTEPPITTVEGIRSILQDVAMAAPAKRYAMTIGCHGMAWIPATPTTARGDAEREYWDYLDEHGNPLTRWFGGSSAAYQTDISTLAEAIRTAGMKMEFILFDDCYMSSIEVAYELRDVADHLIGSTSEIMAYGFPYKEMGAHMIGAVDYQGISQAFFDFYTSYVMPYGTIGITVTSELEALADVMRRINNQADLESVDVTVLQSLDGYSPVRFFDLGDYVRHICTDATLLAEFEAQLERTVPSAWRKHTPSYYSSANGVNDIYTYSGITTSDPSISKACAAKRTTSWWKATH